MSEPQFVEVWWEDSCSEVKYWLNILEELEQIKKDGLTIIRSRGYLLDKSPKYVVIAQCLHFTQNGNYARAGGLLTIPRGCVVKIQSSKMSHKIPK